ncbi:MAG: Rpn family recombination-promoting nuclease/putative transposase, partial [Rickettsia endosymbiont of Labidopullus appendiculatus]|nr:Rpn family recombination-promoting nuclease/putative transposase [Rickettsia endosymbiont of Labidopullus appendiculatus]
MTPDKPKHDEIFRKSMENPIVAKEFLATHLPKDVLALIDSTTVKLEKDSFIEPNLSKTISDVLFSVKSFYNFRPCFAPCDFSACRKTGILSSILNNDYFISVFRRFEL